MLQWKARFAALLVVSALVANALGYSWSNFSW
jgi:hypothetical protein